MAGQGGEENAPLILQGGECVEITPRAESGTRNTYREISNNDFRVICSKREGERVQKS